jgi:hypothetical protein
VQRAGDGSIEQAGAALDATFFSTLFESELGGSWNVRTLDMVTRHDSDVPAGGVGTGAGSAPLPPNLNP